MSSIVTIKDGWNVTIVNNGSFSDNSRSFSSINIAASSSNAGNVTIRGNVTLSGNVTFTGNVSVTGNLTFTGNVNDSGNLTITNRGRICNNTRNEPIKALSLEHGGKRAEVEKVWLWTYYNVPQLQLKRFEASAKDIPYLWFIEHGVYTLIGKTCNVRVDWFVPEKYFTAVMGRAFDLMGFTLFQRSATVRAGLMDEIEYVREQTRKGVVYPIDDENI